MAHDHQYRDVYPRQRSLRGCEKHEHVDRRPISTRHRCWWYQRPHRVNHILPLRERGRYLGITFGLIAVGTTLGPLFGGLIVQHTSWRWVFYLNVPIGGAAMATLIAFLRGQVRQHGKLQDATETDRLARKRRLYSLDGLISYGFILGGEPISMVIVSYNYSTGHGLCRFRHLRVVRGLQILCQPNNASSPLLQSNIRNILYSNLPPQPLLDLGHVLPPGLLSRSTWRHA